MSGTAWWSDVRTGVCGAPVPGPGPWPLPELVTRVRTRVHLPGREVTVAGAATTDDAARASCAGEAAERYAAMLPRAPQAVASTEELTTRARRFVDPVRLGALPAPGPREPIGWLSALDHRLVPVDAALGNLSGEQRLVAYPQGSTGLAAGAGVGPAVEAASAEVVERHVVAGAWPYGLRPAAPGCALEDRFAEASVQAGLEVAVHLLPTPCATASVVLVALHDPERMLVGAGAAYRPDLSAAATKAWTEAVASLAQAAELVDPVSGPLLGGLPGLVPWRADRRYAEGGWADAGDLARTTQLLLDPAVCEAVWARLAEAPVSPPTHVPRPARELVRELFDEVVEVDVSAPDVRAAGGPFVARVLAVGAETVRPAGLTPEELPCPLV